MHLYRYAERILVEQSNAQNQRFLAARMPDHLIIPGLNLIKEYFTFLKLDSKIPEDFPRLGYLIGNKRADIPIHASQLGLSPHFDADASLDPNQDDRRTPQRPEMRRKNTLITAEPVSIKQQRLQVFDYGLDEKSQRAQWQANQERKGRPAVMSDYQSAEPHLSALLKSYKVLLCTELPFSEAVADRGANVFSSCFKEFCNLASRRSSGSILFIENNFGAATANNKAAGKKEEDRFCTGLDLGHMGSLVRSALFFNYAGVIIRNDPVESKDSNNINGKFIIPWSVEMIRSSMGASLYLPSFSYEASVTSDRKVQKLLCNKRNVVHVKRFQSNESAFPLSSTKGPTGPLTYLDYQVELHSKAAATA